MPMNNRLLRPRQTVHPEAADWANRVRANGGSVSGTTLSAVSKFCASIASAGIRDRFYRLNLFCGTGLEACLVPLYRGQSLGGTQFGNTTDTNFNFVSGDYTETGASGGLVGNGSSKYLQTGFPMNSLPSTTDGHAAVYDMTRSSSTAFRGLVGVNQDAATGFGVAADNTTYGIWGNFAFVANNTNGLLLASRTSSSLLTTYVNTTAIVTNVNTVTPTATSRTAVVFARTAISTGAITFYAADRLGGYSIGLGMSAAQVSAYHSAMQAIQTALTRNV
jgi:hypothetical protein